MRFLFADDVARQNEIKVGEAFLTQQSMQHKLYGLRICGGADGQFKSSLMRFIHKPEHAGANGSVAVGDELLVQQGLLVVQVVDEGVTLLLYSRVVGRFGIGPSVRIKVPAHLLLAAANGVLQHFVKLGGPLEGEVLLLPALIVTNSMQFFALYDDAVAIEDERLVRGGCKRARHAVGRGGGGGGMAR